MSFVVPTAIKVALGVVSAAIVGAWAARQVRHLNEELERSKTAAAVTRKELPTLRRDPHSDEWRLR